MSHSSEEKGGSLSPVDKEDEKSAQVRSPSLTLHAESKTDSNQKHPFTPADEVKKHWSTTEHGALVARATAHVYRAIVASQQQGGMQDFLQEKCGLFLDISGELPLECTSVFQVYEKNIEDSLEEFSKSEGKSSLEVMHIIESVSKSHKMAAKNLDMLLAATGYSKFSKMMHRMAVEMEAKRKQEVEAANENACGSHRHRHETRSCCNSQEKNKNINEDIGNDYKEYDENKGDDDVKCGNSDTEIHRDEK